MEYADDTDLQCYREAFNEYAQEYLDWFNTVCLGDYRSTNITGSFLDWIAAGIYGLKRVPLSTSLTTAFGAYATVPFADLAYAGLYIDDNSTTANMSDDIFKRTMTWNLYEGDGFQFTTTWLKRRVMRFLTGANGNDGPFTNTQYVSVVWDARYSAQVVLTISSLMLAYATVPFADLAYAGLYIDDNSTTANMSDDIFKRTMTWNLYEGDGFQFTTTWLKRRVMRFLTGANGNDGPFTNTQYVSVVWDARYSAQVVLTIPTTMNSVASTLALCISNGILNLPLGYNITISILPDSSEETTSGGI